MTFRSRWWLIPALLVGAGAATATGTATTLGFSGAAPGATLPDGWKPYAMARHHTDARVSMVSDAGADAALRIVADHDSAAVAHRLDLPASTQLSWRWKIDRSVAAADLERKHGDDSAARVYVFFALPKDQLSLGQRLKLRLARSLLGHELPRAALCYVWDNGKHKIGTITPSPYFGGLRTIVLRSGDDGAGHWQMQRRDLAADYRAAFGKAAPRVSGVAVASDTDNTGSKATAWFADLVVKNDAGGTAPTP